jgi:hypothetical protein
MFADKMATAPSPTAVNGRDACGKFAKGNKLAKGNPHARRVAALKTSFLDAITPERMKELALALHARALGGDVAAAQLLLRYTLGKPDSPVNPDRVDLDAYRLVKESPWLSDLTRLLTDRRVSPEVAAKMAERYLLATPADVAVEQGIRRTGRQMSDAELDALLEPEE